MRHPSSDKRAAQFMFASPRRAKHVRTSSCAKALARMSYTRGLASFFIVATPASNCLISQGGETPRGHQTAGLAGAGNVSGLEEFFQRFSAESRDHFRIGYAFDAPEFLKAEKARSVAHERSPVELAHHAAFLGAETGLVERRFGVFLEERAVAGRGETVEETVEPQRLGAGGEVEEVSAFELFNALELRIYLSLKPAFACGSSNSATAIAVVIGR